MSEHTLDPYKAPEQRPQGTVVILKPDALERNAHWAILRRVQESTGLELAALHMTNLTRLDVFGLYGHQAHQDFWPDMVNYLTRGPVIVAIFEGQAAIEKVRALVGHYDKSQKEMLSNGYLTIRSAYADRSKPNHVNLVHASSGIKEYEQERLWLIQKMCPRATA